MSMRPARRAASFPRAGPAFLGSESAKRLLGATAALFKQRQAHPKRNRGGGQRHPDRPIAAGEKAQSSAARKLSISRA